MTGRRPTPGTTAELDPRDAEIAELQSRINRAMAIAEAAFRRAGNHNREAVDLACDLKLALTPPGRR